MKRLSRQTWLRIMLSLLLGACVAWVPIAVAGSALYWVGDGVQQNQTRTSLRAIDRALDDYKRKNRAYPRALSQLDLRQKDVQDGWNRAWNYSSSGTQPLIESLGRDGKRGGHEQNADLSNRNPRPDAARLPFWKWLIDPNVRMVTLTAIIAGLIAGIVCYCELKEREFKRENLSKIMVSLFVTFAIAAFGAAFIAIAHVPSGH